MCIYFALRRRVSFIQQKRDGSREGGIFTDSSRYESIPRSVVIRDDDVSRRIYARAPCSPIRSEHIALLVAGLYIHTRSRQIRGRNSAVPSALLPPTTLLTLPPAHPPILDPLPGDIARITRTNREVTRTYAGYIRMLRARRYRCTGCPTTRDLHFRLLVVRRISASIFVQRVVAAPIVFESRAISSQRGFSDWS